MIINFHILRYTRTPTEQTKHCFIGALFIFFFRSEIFFNVVFFFFLRFIFEGTRNVGKSKKKVGSLPAGHHLLAFQPLEGGLGRYGNP